MSKLDYKLEKTLIEVTLFVIIVFVIQMAVLYWFAAPGLEIPKNILELDFEDFAIFEAGHRLNLLSLTCVYIFTCITICGKVLMEISYTFLPRDRKTLKYGYCVVAVVGITSFVVSLLGGRDTNVDLLHKSWFQAIWSENRDNENWDYETFDMLLNVISVFSALTIPALVIWGVSCLAKLPGTSDAGNWKQQSNRLRFNIFFSSFLLVIGVLLFKNWTQYPLAMLQGNDFQLINKGFGELASSLTIYTGMTYSLILIAYALPVTIKLSKNADAIAANNINKRDPQLAKKSRDEIAGMILQEKENEKLVISYQEVIQTFIALIAPMVTGTLPSLSTIFS